jgi:mycothiol synthase
MTEPVVQPPTICRATGASLEESLRLVFGGLAPGQSEGYAAFVGEEVRAGRMSAEGLLEARRDGRLVGAMWLEIQAGHAALFWPPRLACGESRLTAGQLLAAGCELAARRGVRIAQALLAAPGLEEDTDLRAAGFEPLAALLYLGWETGGPAVACCSGPLQYEPYDPADRTRMARLVEATYTGTLDCPALNGIRSIDDILQGYQAVGEFSPQRWLYARREGRDVGCLLLADHPKQGNLELAYMGLIPEARGNGWGGQVCRQAQSLAQRLGRARLVVAVDAANLPALEMYAQTGFRIWDRRSVYFKPIA